MWFQANWKFIQVADYSNFKSFFVPSLFYTLLNTFALSTFFYVFKCWCPQKRRNPHFGLVILLHSNSFSLTFSLTLENRLIPLWHAFAALESIWNFFFFCVENTECGLRVKKEEKNFVYFYSIKLYSSHLSAKTFVFIHFSAFCFFHTFLPSCHQIVAIFHKEF